MKRNPRNDLVTTLRLAFALLLVVAAGPLASHAKAEPRHGISAFGPLKYPAGFPHFDYVNPRAPKGGRFAHVGSGGRLTFASIRSS